VVGGCGGRLEETEKAVEDVREKIDQQNTQLCDFEAEISMLKRRIESLTYDRDKDKKHIAQLQDALNRARIVSRSSSYHTIECGPMPNGMVALPNIGGALCSTPQSLADAHY